MADRGSRDLYGSGRATNGGVRAQCNQEKASGISGAGGLVKGTDQRHPTGSRATEPSMAQERLEELRVSGGTERLAPDRGLYGD